MKQTVVGLFDDTNAAHRAFEALLENGFDRNDISVMRSNKMMDAASGVKPVHDMPHTDGTAAGAGIGAVLGGIAGLAAGLAAVTIPGIGPAVVAGPLAGVLAGASVGAAAGSIIGALTDAGIPEYEARFYAEGLRRGSTLLAVHTDDSNMSRAIGVLDDFKPVNIDQRTAEWRAEGWTNFDPDASPHWEGEELAHATAPDAGPTYDPTYDRTTAEMSRTFEMYDPDFRTDWEQTRRGSGYGYQRYRPAYQYGYKLATADRLQDKSWNEVEAEARREWESQHPNDRWEEFKDAVRQAWQTVRNDTRGGRG